MHIEYLVILTCSFLMAAILALFFDLLSGSYSQSSPFLLLHSWLTSSSPTVFGREASATYVGHGAGQ